MKTDKKPQVVYKPKSPISKLSAEHIGHLRNLTEGGLMRTVIPLDEEEYLVKNGYARNAVGGLMATDMGHRALMMYHKEVK